MPRRITPLRDLIAVIQLWRLLLRLRPQIVHAHTPKGGLLGMMAAWAAGVPVRVYNVLGMPLATATGKRRFLLRWSERVSCLLAHRVLCISRSLREAVMAEGLCPDGKIEVLREGSSFGVDAGTRFNPAAIPESSREVTRTRLGIPSDAPVIGFIGRVVRDKGIVELMDAWKDLRDEFPELHLLIAGPLEAQDSVPIAVVDSMRRDPRIHLVGRVSETPSLYAVMSVLVLPTYREGFGHVNLEAAAMELPVVATQTVGCVDAVQDGRTGILVHPVMRQRLAQAIGAYLRDPQLRREHGEAGRRRVLRDFRCEDLSEATFQEYVRLLRSRGLPVAEPTRGSTDEGQSRPTPGGQDSP